MYVEQYLISRILLSWITRSFRYILLKIATYTLHINYNCFRKTDKDMNWWSFLCMKSVPSKSDEELSTLCDRDVGGPLCMYNILNYKYLGNLIN